MDTDETRVPADTARRSNSLAPEAIGRTDLRFAELSMGVAWGLVALLAAFPPSGAYFVPWLSIPMSVLGCIHFLRRAFDRRPRIVIDEAGVLDRTSILGGELRIPWTQVRGLSFSRWYGGVQIEVHDLGELLAGAGAGRRLGIVLGRLVGKRTITLGTTLLGVSRREVRRRLEAGLDRHERLALGLPDSTGTRGDGDTDP